MSQANDLSFLPDDYVARRARSRANRLCGSLLLVTMFGVAGAFVYAQDRLDAIRQQYATVNAQYQREADRLKRLDELQKQQTELARRAKLAEALIEKAPRTEVLASLARSMPAETTLSEVVLNSRIKLVAKTPEQILAEKQARGAKKNAAVENEVKPKLYDTTLRMVGMAYTDLQVAEYINNLSRSPYFEDVNLLVSREVSYQDQPMRRFEVEMVVRSEPKPSTEAQATGAANTPVATLQEQAAQ